MAEEENIKEKIKKQGLLLEVEIATILEKKGWLVFQEVPYLDEDENKNRKLDIFALRSVKDKIILLNIECKRSEKNVWVFYTKRADGVSFFTHIITEFDSILQNEPHNISTSYRIPFEGNDEFNKACYQVMKYIKSTREGTIMPLPKGGQVFSIPLIIFDGHLYQFSSYPAIDLERVNLIRYLSLNFLPIESKVIRIIQKDYFEKFLDDHLIH